jgi:tetratricopeptide (TPR) repeat protein
MNRSDFINMLEDKVQVNRQMIGEVYEIIDIFPYFQSAHMLLLKGLQNTADVKFEKQLRISGIHIADREVLYYLLLKKPAVVAPKAEVNRQEEAVSEYGNDHQQVVIETAKNSEQLISEIEKDDGVVRKEETDDPTHLHSHSILISSEAEAIESESVMLLMDEETAPDEEKVFYMDPGFSVPDNSDLLELDTDQDQDLAALADILSQEQTADDAGKKKNLGQSELIDKFILANPRIEPVRESSKVPLEDISKPSAEQEGRFVTETLARIYINQGYYSKAIDIYQALILKFPEKSSYFASQIELVKVYLKK